MFDQENYESDEGENVMYSSKHMGESKLSQNPSFGMDFNHLTGEGESLLKMMKERGFDLTENEVKKIQNRRQFKSKDKQGNKTKQKAGFYDGGNSATMQELLKGLNKAFSKADPQQASCILSYILERKNITPEERNKFGIMKCNLLYGLGAYQQSLNKSRQLMEKPLNKLSAAIFSNLIAKSRAQISQIFEGYFDFLRAKSLIAEYKEQLQAIKIQKLQKNTKEQSQSTQQQQQFKDSQLDTVVREINHTQLEYNIKLSQIRNSNNLIHPYFPQFRQRNVKQVVCGDYHALFLIGTPLYSQNLSESDQNWENQVFGVGENTVGQITGISNHNMIKQPVLISHLSGKGIQGIWATRQSSLAYDKKGNIYEWGIKEDRNQMIDITFSVGQKIKLLEKGYRHYTILTESKRFYTWGVIKHKQTTDVYSKPKPHLIQLKDIEGFSCGKGHVVAWDSNGEVYGLGENEHGQLGLEGQLYIKDYKLLNKDKIMGDIRQVYCLGDCTFFINTYEEVFYQSTIKVENPQLKIKQAQFYSDPPHIISISGTIGNYYVTDSLGNLHKWDVDSSVKFKINMDEKVTQRYIASSRGAVYRVKSLIEPKLCSVNRITKNPKTFEPIQYQIGLADRYGPYGNQLYNSLHCQIFLSTYKANPQNILKQNKLYLENIETNKDQKIIILSEIVENRAIDCSIRRLQEKPYDCNLIFIVDRATRYFFYVLIQSQIIYNQQLLIQVSQRERQLQEQTKIDRQMREQQRRKKAQFERQRLLEEKLRKEQQEVERKRQTQRRAQETLRKHMREQQQQRVRVQEEKKRRQQLQTGGGFDLSKMKKNSMEKSGDSFLPNINLRPSSKRKVNLPKPSQIVSIPNSKIQKSKQFLNEIATSSSYNSGFQTEKTQKREKSKPNIGQNVANLTNTGLIGNNTTTTRPLVKRGLSKGKKN